MAESRPPAAHPPPMTPDAWREAADPAVMQACLAGDQQAWAELVARYQRLVFSIPCGYGLDDPTGEDVLQEVFSILSRQMAGIRNQRAISSTLNSMISKN